MLKLKINKWIKWGFSSGPFDHCALHANQDGADLLVGREEELQSALDSLLNIKKVTSFNGAVGVGKTSLANVAAFYLRELAKSEHPGRHYLVCEKNIEYVRGDSIDDFEFRVYLEVAKAIIKYKDGNSSVSWANFPHYIGIKTCVNDPLFKSGGINFAPIGGVDRGTSSNDTVTYGKQGFVDTIKSWVSELFPNENSGFVICVIDNFELMDAAEELVALLEKNRDRIFDIYGVKFVLCGANNSILRLKSPWMAAYLDETIEVVNVALSCSAQIYETRLSKYKNSDEFYIPLVQSDFEQLAEVIQVNVRDLLGEAENYCLYIARQTIEPKKEEEKHDFFQAWLGSQTQNALKSIEAKITRSCWIVLDAASQTPFNGVFKSGDYGALDVVQGSYSNIIARLKELKLINEEDDETSRKKKIYRLTPKAYYVLYAKTYPPESL